MSMMMRALFFLFISVSVFFTISFADIRNTNITTTENQSLFLIDVFGFTNTGFIQLNISNISISNPIRNNHNLNLNLSQVGFFLSPIRHMLDYHKDDLEKQCLLDLVSDFPVKMVYTFDELRENLNSVSILFNNTDSGEFEFFFQNCLWDLEISMTVRSAMYNIDEKSGRLSYLSANMTHFGFYFTIIFIYQLLFGVWMYVIFNTRPKVSPIFLVMADTVGLKVLSLLFEVLHEYYIMNTGNPQGWGVLVAFMSDFLTDVPRIVLLFLIYSGWTLVIPKLESRSKIFLTTVVILQLINTIWKIVTLKLQGPCGTHSSYGLLAHRLVNIMILTPTTVPRNDYTNRLLVNEGKSDGEAVVGKRLHSVDSAFAIYFLVIYLVEIVAMYVPYNTWKGVALCEWATLVFYAFTMYKLFWPIAKTQIIPISDDEEKTEAQTLLKGTVDD